MGGHPIGREHELGFGRPVGVSLCDQAGDTAFGLGRCFPAVRRAGRRRGPAAAGTGRPQRPLKSARLAMDTEPLEDFAGG
jgi:hypothetical protein